MLEAGYGRCAEVSLEPARHVTDSKMFKYSNVSHVCLNSNPIILIVFKDGMKLNKICLVSSIRNTQYSDQMDTRSRRYRQLHVNHG